MANDFLADTKMAVASGESLDDIILRVQAFLKGRPFLESGRDNKDLENESLLLMARLAGHQRRARQGQVSPADAVVEKNVLQHSLLEFIDVLERASSRIVLPALGPSMEPAGPTTGNLEAIIGANRLKSIAWLKAGVEAGRSVCRIRWSGATGTGFLLDGGWLVTNHHVLPTQEAAGKATAMFNFEEDLGGVPANPALYSLDPSTHRASAAMDCAAVRIRDPLHAAPEIASWGFLRWALASPGPVRGDFVSIIQHPWGGPKQVAVSENQVVETFRHLVHYTTDTDLGSSGSPVLDDHWQVIALHHAGGNGIIDSRGHKVRLNEGILGSNVRVALGL